MKRKLVAPTLENTLNLFSARLNEFKGESRRSYQKAYSSFQIYVIGHYSLSYILDKPVVTNWVIDLVTRGLTPKTVSFYLDKITSLYSNVGHKFEGGRLPVFKEVKADLRQTSSEIYYADVIKECINNINPEEKKDLVEAIKSKDFKEILVADPQLKYKFTCLALKAGIRADILRKIIGETPDNLSYLNLVDPKEDITDMQEETLKNIVEFIEGERLQWFAMRLRPKVKYEQILSRFSQLTGIVKMPELFYPCEEIVKKVGGKVMWKDQPVIRDIIFFRDRKSEIYSLFTNLYDLAWCYRTPGVGYGNYASIPDKAMEEFRKSIGFLSGDYEVAPCGEMEFKPGDEVIIVNGKYVEEHGHILKKPSFDENGNKIYRVSLLHGHGHWDIGIDARLIKKVK